MTKKLTIGLRHRSQYVTCADLALSRVVKVVVHALLFDEARARWLDYVSVAVYSRSRAGAANEFVLNQGPVVRGLLGKRR